jgi:FrmR/RcnR family transcriptional regulator, repressor of frmRAB operon
MAHTIKNKSKLIARVHRIKGQVGAVERALEAEIGCAHVLMLVASLRGAVQGLTVEVPRGEYRERVASQFRRPPSWRWSWSWP